jgi:hypothetical protein
MHHRTFARPSSAASSGLLAVVLAVTIMTAGCGRDLTLEEWESAWRTATTQLPPVSALLDGDPQKLCSATLGDVRQAGADLITAPNSDISEAFLRWTNFAESVFFDCPPNSGTNAGFEASYRELDRLATEVDALLAFEHELRDGG